MGSDLGCRTWVDGSFSVLQSASLSPILNQNRLRSLLEILVANHCSGGVMSTQVPINTEAPFGTPTDFTRGGSVCSPPLQDARIDGPQGYGSRYEEGQKLGLPAFPAEQVDRPGARIKVGARERHSSRIAMNALPARPRRRSL